MWAVVELDGEEVVIATYGDAAGEPYGEAEEAEDAAEELQSRGPSEGVSFNFIELPDPPPPLLPLPS